MPKQVRFNKEEMLSLLIPLFIEKGFNGTSMQDIVDVTKLNRSSIYNTFGDKQSLFMTVLENYAGRQLKLKDEILRMDSNIKSALKKFFEKLFLSNTESRNTEGCLLTNCSLELGQSDKSVQSLLLNSKEIMIKNFEEILNVGIEKGSILASINPKEYALFLYNNLQGLRVLNGTNLDIKATKSIISNLFENI